MVAGAARAGGHDVCIVDLQVEHPRQLWRMIDRWRPDAVCIGGNYLVNVPEIIDTAKAIKQRQPGCFVFVGGHSASFVASDLLAHGAGAIDCVIKGEGEASVPLLLRAVQEGRDLAAVPGAVSPAGEGPPPRLVESLDMIRPARDLLARRRRYFIGTLDPCASIEFARGCPWDCTFCSAWTFYGRSYRVASPNWQRCTNRACSLSMTSPSCMPAMASKSARRSSDAASANSITWRHAVTFCCATWRYLVSGAIWA